MQMNGHVKACSVLVHGETRLHAIFCLGMYGIQVRSIECCYLIGIFWSPVIRGTQEIKEVRNK